MKHQADSTKVRSEYYRLTEENASLVSQSNNNQKIHYVSVLKQQLKELMEENESLKLSLKK